ncbi:MAG: hypothetical protein CSA62_07520 [Planctomycetota bacterium]|nr:MAG: hypothetical protein CSA62_07520 [Planctomycetota bacterium]
MPKPLQILHLSPSHIVIAKAPGLLSIEAPGRDPRLSVVLRLRELLESRGEASEVYAVHRIDEETSGALVLARSPEARAHFDALFASHRIERIYHAIVLGTPHPRSGRIESQLVVGEDGVVVSCEQGGERAVMDYAVVHQGPQFSVVACRLETGRRNQIRVQLADRGCPLVGDRKYGRFDKRFDRVRARRSMLHATALGFVAPGEHAAKTHVAPFPDDFEKLLGPDLLQALTPTS